jgi:NAD(P)H-hydrate epimerase
MVDYEAKKGDWKVIKENEPITCEEMKAMDHYAIHQIGIPSMVLMERASLQVLKHLETERFQRYGVICGRGNNGGDGVAVARHLLLMGKEISLVLLGEEEKGTGDFNRNVEIYKNLMGPVEIIAARENLNLLERVLTESQVLVDGIFGIGLTRPVEGLYREAIERINDFSGLVVAIDIPSGLDGNTGEALGIAVKAGKTVTFQRIKKGISSKNQYTGRVYAEDIGIPDFAGKTLAK